MNIIYNILEHMELSTGTDSEWMTYIMNTNIQYIQTHICLYIWTYFCRWMIDDDWMTK